MNYLNDQGRRMQSFISRRVIFAATAAVMTLLTGCSTLESLSPFDSKRVEYKSATSGPSLEVPPDLTPPKYDDRYRVGGTATLSGVNAQNRAAALQGQGGVLPIQTGIRIEKSGTERWLVVTGNADDIYKRVREFWASLNLNLVVDNPGIGIMETDWAENRARINDDIIRRTIGKVFDNVYSSGTRDKYRTRVERAANNTTEVYVSHRGMEEKSIGNTASPQFRWEPRKPEPEFEAEMLARLMQYLGTPPDQAKLLAASAVSPNASTATTGSTPRVDQAQIVKNGKLTTLSMNDGFDRAWRRVGLALDRVGFTVVDRDRTAGTYFVRYADPDNVGKKDGVLDRLAFWRDDKALAEQYRITVKETSGKTDVVVQDKSGTPDDTAIGARIVTLLHEQLK
jgi:outer membrane protein assembly factor BamC